MTDQRRTVYRFKHSRKKDTLSTLISDLSRTLRSPTRLFMQTWVQRRADTGSSSDGVTSTM